MKVLMINSVCGIRSTGRICTDIAEVLEANGHETKIVYGRERVPQIFEKYSVRIGNEFDIKCNALKARFFDNEGFNAKNMTKKLIAYIDDYKPDMIHLHNLHGYYVNIELLFTYLSHTHIPIVFTMHDCWAITGHCAYFTMEKCEKWKVEGCSKCPQKKKYPSSYVCDSSARNWTKKKHLFSLLPNMMIVTPSKWLAKLVSTSYLQKNPISVIPNGIDINVFRLTESDFRTRYRVKDKKIVLGVASIWDERKGLPDILKLSELLDEKYKLIIVGLTKKQIGKLPSNIIGIEQTNSIKEIAEIYTAADVFFNPTYEDNYPTTNLEARSCGTPVITYRTGGSPESAGENAIVVEQGDLLATLSAIQMITRNQIEVSEDDRMQFSKEAMAKKYLELYLNIGKDKYACPSS